MSVTVEIKTGTRRVIDFFLDSFIKSTDEALKLRQKIEKIIGYINSKKSYPKEQLLILSIYYGVDLDTTNADLTFLGSLSAPATVTSPEE